DLRRSAQWYATALGLPVLEERLDGGALYWFRLACGTGIILDRNPDLPEDPIVQFAYPAENIESAYAYMQTLGIELLTGILRPNPSLAFFSFADPDGNKMMVMQSGHTDEVLDRLPDAVSPIENRLGGIFVHVTDMARAARFHSEVLGL